MSFWLAASFIALGVAEFFALGAILRRHAIPRAPGLFQVLVGAPVVVSATAAILLAYMSFEEAEALWGVDLDVHRLVFTASSAAAWWALVAYSFHFYLSVRCQEPPGGDDEL